VQLAGLQLMDIRIATHYNFEDFVRNQGLEFAPIVVISELLQSEEGQKLLTGQQNKLVSDELFRQQLADGWQTCQGTNVVIFNPLATWGYHREQRLVSLLASCIPRALPYVSFPEICFRNQKSFDSSRNYASIC